MDGLEATRRIRALGGARGQVPIVALTAQAFTEQVAECLAAGMDSHLPKPFDPATLLAAVARAVTAGRMHAVVSMPEMPAGMAAAAVSDSTETARVAATAVAAVIGSDQLLVNATGFERTARFLSSATVASYLQTIVELGEGLLRRLREPGALAHRGDELADEVHFLAGSAGMFGFDRLFAVGRGFEEAVRSGSSEAPAQAEGLAVAVAATLEAIRDFRPVAGETVG